MPMKLEGSCQCGTVQFTVDSHTPVPYQLCACSICRKCGGYSGSVNLGAIADSLKITSGEQNIKKYKAISNRGHPHERLVTSDRAFCMTCSAMLWVWDASWPELLHPFASVIDTPLPLPEEMLCIRADSKPGWARWPEGAKVVHEEYGEASIEEWHRAHGVYVE